MRQNVWVLNDVPLPIRKTVIRELLTTKARDDLDKFLEMNDIECGKFTFHKDAGEYRIRYIKDPQVCPILYIGIIP
jgi:hypothetical protein